jgi:hypothetical protein
MQFHGKSRRHPLLSFSDTNDSSKRPQTLSPSSAMPVCHYSSLPSTDNYRIDSL